MFGSAVLDTAIGLIFIFFVFSTMCSSAFSMISRALETRGKLLQQGLLYLLDEEMRAKLMEHPLVKSIRLKEGKSGMGRWGSLLRRLPFFKRAGSDMVLAYDPRPSYIPSSVFSRALLDIAIATAKEAEGKGPNWDLALGELADMFAANLAQSIKDHEVKEKAISYITFKLGTLIDENEENGIKIVESLIDDFGIKDPKLRQDISLQVRTLFAYRTDVLELIRQGLTQLPFPPETCEVFNRQIELLMRQQGLEEKFKTAQERLNKVASDIENWYNHAMDGLTAIFKRLSRVWLLGIATVLALGFNINTLTVTQALWTNPTLRDSVVETAGQRLRQETSSEGEQENNPVVIFREDLNSLYIPVGWTSQELKALGLPDELAQVENEARPVPGGFSMVIGFALTILAGTMGAPFWFDLLNKVVNLRTEVKPKPTDTAAG